MSREGECAACGRADALTGGCAGCRGAVLYCDAACCARDAARHASECAGLLLGLSEFPDKIDAGALEYTVGARRARLMMRTGRLDDGRVVPAAALQRVRDAVRAAIDAGRMDGRSPRRGNGAPYVRFINREADAADVPEVVAALRDAEARATAALTSEPLGRSLSPQMARLIAPPGAPEGTLVYVASGFFQGTTHRASLDLDTGAYSGHVHTIVDGPLLVAIRTAVRNAVAAGVFHERAPAELRGRGGDVGTTWFRYGELAARPRDVPELARLLLQVDAGLAQSPGGLTQQ